MIAPSPERPSIDGYPAGVLRSTPAPGNLP
jgi:hypothetical protein